MTSSILGLGVAWPPHQMTQDEAVQMFTDIVCEHEKQSRFARVLFRKSEVNMRHTVVPHRVAYNWCQETNGHSANHTARGDLAIPSEVTPSVVPGKSLGPSTRERMELYSRFASNLAIESSQRALQQSGLEPDQITHLITVTCTGFDAPGVDIELITKLGLPNTTERIQIGFMGCHGAINGLRAARAISDSDPDARVLLCAVELCSLHYRFTWDTEGIIGNALFADGSAAIVLGNSVADPSPTDQPHWKVVDTGSVVIANSKQTMSWSIGDHGFDMRLTNDVGDAIESQLSEWLTAWLAKRNIGLDDIDFWGVHPGGPRIVSAVKNSLGLDDQVLSTSRSVLERYGNMSSPTVLFILNEFRKSAVASVAANGSHGPRHCLLLGFGPGLVAETALLSVH